MPELAEVEYFRRNWARAEGARVINVSAQMEKRIFRAVEDARFPEILIGSRFNRSERKGKQLCFHFGRDYWLGLHMGMTGRTLYCRDPEAKHKYAYLILDIEKGERLIFQDPRLFGKVYFSCGQASPDWWSRIPEELTSDQFTLERMNAFLMRRSRSPIKTVLLMQEGFPGIGNWMADEILWRCRIAPYALAGSIAEAECRALYASIRTVCDDALRVIADGWKKPPDDWLFNHRWKDGGICPKTERALVREKINGRTACWSPYWQVYR